LKHQFANFIYCLFLPILPKKKKKRGESDAAHWCFKIYSPCSMSFISSHYALHNQTVGIYPGLLTACFTHCSSVFTLFRLSTLVEKVCKDWKQNVSLLLSQAIYYSFIDLAKAGLQAIHSEPRSLICFALKYSGYTLYAVIYK
jgi:hypothetical protein